MQSSVQASPPLVQAAPRIANGARASRGVFRKPWPLYLPALVLSDALALGLGFRLAHWIRFELALPFFRLEVAPSLEFYQSLVLALVPMWCLLFAALGLYRPSNLLGGTHEYELIFRASSVGLLLVIVAGFLGEELVIARGWLVMAWAFAFLLPACGRFGLRRMVYWLRRRGYFQKPTLLVGANEEGRLLAEQIAGWQESGLHLVGVVGEGLTPGSKIVGEVQALGTLDQLADVIDRFAIEEVVIATSALTRDQMLHVFEKYGVSDDVNLRLSSGLFEIITTGLQVREVASVPLVSVNKVRLTGLDRLGKWALDYGLTIPGVLLASPLLGLIALVVRLDSPGPILHRRRVMGLNGRQFDAFKFRTMHVDADRILEARPDLWEELAQSHKLVDDPRITRVGRFLRRYSLDELPQIFNVLRREMSLIGPRMISPEEMPKYNQWGINLLTVRPGITGLWQVSGRSSITYVERVRLDMYYIRNWSIWLDVHLLVRTIPAVLKGVGAY
jgi:exopolysaccharide biosynthesis polyprenyl glycosylphosphotransferase